LVSLLDATTRADIDDGTLHDLALFHMDGTDTTLLAQSDKHAVTDTGHVDTLSDVSGTAYEKYKVIVRPTGIVEFWQSGVRMLPDTVFAVTDTVDLAGVVTAEKSATATVSDVSVRNFRVASGKAA
jgi:hypothetical protein